MNKKTNSIIFMAVATLLNIALLFVFIMLGIILVSMIPFDESSTTLFSVAIMIVFFLSIALSFIIYSKIVKWATVKFNLEEKLDPLLTPKRNRRNRLD